MAKVLRSIEREAFLEAVSLSVNLEGQMELSGGRKVIKKTEKLLELILKSQKSRRKKKCGLE